MPFVVALFLLLGSTIAVADDDAPPNHVDLDVKPVLCILDRHTPACDMDFLVVWRSTVEGHYCLFSQLEPVPLHCWQEEAAGRHEETRTVDKSFQYWLTGDDSEEPLAAVTVEVMTIETNDRRRKRRTRHVWDIL